MCQIVPHPFITILESSPHDTTPASIWVSSLKKLSSPHMWLLAPMSRYQIEFKQPRLSSSPDLLSFTRPERHSASNLPLLSSASEFFIIIKIHISSSSSSSVKRFFSFFFRLTIFCYMADLATVVAACRFAFSCIMTVLATPEAFHLWLGPISLASFLTRTMPILLPGLICALFNITSATSSATSSSATSFFASRTSTLSILSFIQIKLRL